MGNSLSRYWIAVTLTKQLVNPTKVSYQLTSGAVYSTSVQVENDDFTPIEHNYYMVIPL